MDADACANSAVIGLVVTLIVTSARGDGEVRRRVKTVYVVHDTISYCVTETHIFSCDALLFQCSEFSSRDRSALWLAALIFVVRKGSAGAGLEKVTEAPGAQRRVV